MGYSPTLEELRSSVPASSLSLGSLIETPKAPVPSSRLEVLSQFDNFFKEVTAEAPQDIEQAFRLRYQVYCLEQGFEPPESFSSGMERDRYDSFAHHSLLVDKASALPLGTVRLILPAATPDWVEDLPVADYAAAESIAELERLPAGSTAEVSRFAIARMARQKSRRSLAGEDGAALESRRDTPWRDKLRPYMSLGLIRGLVRLSVEKGITHWCLAAEPTLLRRLRSFGLHFKAAGPLVDHRGLRQVCYAELKTLLARAEDEHPEFWHIMTQGGFLAPAGPIAEAA